MEKNKERWIKKHDADTLDPEYRRLVGTRSWLLDYMKSICNWETGIVDDWDLAFIQRPVKFDPETVTP